MFPLQKKSKSIYLLVTMAIAVFVIILAISTKYAYHSTIFLPLHYHETFYSKPISEPKFIITLMGAPGSGKSILARNCNKKLGFETLSLGNMFRQEAASQTKLGRKIRPYLKLGKLVPNNLTNKVVENWIKKAVNRNKSVIIDGYPRTEEQAKAFFEILNQNRFSSYQFIPVLIKTPQDRLFKRLSNRLICSNKTCQATFISDETPPKTKGLCDLCNSPLITRKDDLNSIIKDQRFKIYEKEGENILSIYEKNQQLELINHNKNALSSVDQKNFNHLQKILSKNIEAQARSY